MFEVETKFEIKLKTLHCRKPLKIKQERNKSNIIKISNVNNKNILMTKIVNWVINSIDVELVKIIYHLWCHGQQEIQIANWLTLSAYYKTLPWRIRWNGTLCIKNWLWQYSHLWYSLASFYDEAHLEIYKTCIYNGGYVLIIEHCTFGQLFCRIKFNSFSWIIQLHVYLVHGINYV